MQFPPPNEPTEDPADRSSEGPDGRLGGDRFDPRLSPYIDQQLTSDEAADLEAEMARDSALAGQLDQIRDLGRWLRLSAKTTDGSLPPGFADRIVDASIERARREGFADDHPLILAGDQPSPAPNAGPSPSSVPSASSRPVDRRWRRSLGLAAAVAASATGLWFVMGRETGDATIAMTTPPDPGSSVSVSTDPTITNRPDGTRRGGGVRDAVVGAGTSERRSPVDRPSPPAEPGFDELANSVPEPLGIDQTDAGAVDPVDVEKLAVANPASAAGLDDGEMTSFDGAVMVFEIRCRDGVTADEVIADAMRSAGLDYTAQRTATDDLVAAATNASGIDGDESFQLLYLSASAKRLDRVYLELVADRDRVRGVGLSLAMSAPIVAAAKTLRQRTNDSMVAVAPPDMRGRLSDDLSDLTFLPMTGGDGLVGGSTGGDEIAQAIFIVR